MELRKGLTFFTLAKESLASSKILFRPGIRIVNVLTTENSSEHDQMNKLLELT